MSEFGLFVGSRFVGDFKSPSDFNFSYQWMCQHCGSIEARRLQYGGGSVFVFHSITCKECAAGARCYIQPVLFRIPFEIGLNWTPVEILAEEFLFNSGVYANYERNPHNSRT